MIIDPLLKESLKSILGGTIFSASVFLSSFVIRVIMKGLSLQNMWLGDTFEKITTFGALVVLGIFILKSFIEMGILAYKTLKKTWKR